MMAPLQVIITLLATLLAATQAYPTISITGTKFFTDDGKQFYIKGKEPQYIAFQ